VLNTLPLRPRQGDRRPIFHVNGDNVEAVNFVCQLAADYHAKFKKDVVIDIVYYHRCGRNETDQPSFTQPRMYAAIAKQPTPLTKYTQFLVKRGTFTEKDIEEHKGYAREGGRGGEGLRAYD
jgi:2-oxoglutarate dehydrogenase E1 component